MVQNVRTVRHLGELWLSGDDLVMFLAGWARAAEAAGWPVKASAAASLEAEIANGLAQAAEILTPAATPAPDVPTAEIRAALVEHYKGQGYGTLAAILLAAGRQAGAIPPDD